MSRKFPRHATNKHHVYPRSRCREMGIDPEFEGNVRVVNMTKHEAWHILFSNMTPQEAIENIEEEWSLSKEGEASFRRELKRSVRHVKAS